MQPFELYRNHNNNYIQPNKSISINHIQSINNIQSKHFNN